MGGVEGGGGGGGGRCGRGGGEGGGGEGAYKIEERIKVFQENIQINILKY